MSLIARDYQKAAVAAVWEKINAGSKGTLCAMATGIGKSAIAGLIAQSIDKLLFIVDREELAFQGKKALQEITGRPVSLECGPEYKAYRTAPNAKIVVAMSQSMIRRLRHYSQDRFEYIMEDECHHSPAATRTAIRNHFTGSKAVIGFSATPKRADNKAQGLVYDTVAYEMDIVTSLDLGWLTPFQSRVLSCNELDLKHVDVTCGELNKKQLLQQYEKQALVERIANRTVAIADGRQTVIFAQSVEQSKQIDRYLKSIGEKSVHVDGKLPRFVRRDRLAAFGVGQYRYIVNCNLIEEGVDVPGIEVVAMASAMRSSVRFIQRCGRGLRPVCELSHESAAIRRKEIADSRKPHCTIIDFIGQMDDHCSSMCFAGDLLGGDFDDETRKVAIRMAADRENPDIPSILREAKEIVEKRKKKRSVRDIKMEVVNRWRSSRIEEQNWAVNTKFCPYDVLKLHKSDAEAQVTKDEMYGRSYSASESYLKACQLKQVEISSLTSKEVVYLARVLRNRAATHCSYYQSRAIHARGYDASNLTKAQGNDLYERIKQAGFVRPPEDGPNMLYAKHAGKSEPVQNFTFL